MNGARVKPGFFHVFTSRIVRWNPLTARKNDGIFDGIDEVFRGRYRQGMKENQHPYRTMASDIGDQACH